MNDAVFAVLPTLFDDVNQRMTDWGTEGKINPFEDVYRVGIFVLSHEYRDTAEPFSFYIARISDDRPHGVLP
jgi:hypothetical protein